MTTTQKFNCIFCKDVFDNKEELQEHFRKHGDPKFKNRFENDSQTCDEKSKEKFEMVNCDVCSQVFPTISKAITHKHKVHPDHDAKYFCPWCGKLFTMKHLYNVHVQSNHGGHEKTEEKDFRCDSCNVDFFLPSAMINHNKFFHRQDTDLPDVGQSKKVRYYNQEVIPIYYCAFCGEEYENKVNLIKHISDDHEDENQSPDEVLKCPLCNAVFYHLDAYEIHLTFHSSEDMFSVRNNEFNDLLDYSLETVPPIIEKVENLDTEEQIQDADAESTLNAVGIEKFLELALDQSDDNPVKVKKHKKHKKAKKSAITLDEFLNMNKDVFGEGLDFHGIEEVPTRVVKKQLKNNKKATDAAVTSAELEKLKKAGIVVKRKVGRIPMIKSLKVANSKPIRNAQNKSVNKINPDQEIKTSSEVLSKLINQSNNQIKIVKKSCPNNAINEPKLITNDNECETSHGNMSANHLKEFNQTNEETKSTSILESEISTSQNITKHSNSPKPEEPPVPATSDTSLSNKLTENDNNSDVDEVTKNAFHHTENMQKISVSDIDHSSIPVSNEFNEAVSKKSGEAIEKNKSDQITSDLEFEKERENESDTDNEKLEKHVDEIPPNDSNSNHTNLISSKAGSLFPLKHLSHLITVKSVSQNKNTTSPEPSNYAITETKDVHNPQNISKRETLSSANKACLNKPKIVDKDPTLDALKTLSKNITIKSLSTKINTNENQSEDDSDIDEAEKTILRCNLKSQDIHSNRNVKLKQNKAEMSEPMLDSLINNSLDNQEKKYHLGKPSVTQSGVGKRPNKIIVETDNSLPTSNANILKRLTNITTKPIIKKNNDLAPTMQKTKTNVQTEKKKEEIIEIFDIDDSEDETENDNNDKTTNDKKPEPNQNSMNSMDALKNLSKNITVKSLNPPSLKKNINIENNIKIEKQDNKDPSYPRYTKIDAQPNVQCRNVAFKNVLQGLPKNITIKPRNASPSQFLKSQEYKQESKLLEDREDEGSDSDSCSGNIKITELDDEMGNNEDNSECELDIGNPIVESPNESCSDNEEINYNERDFETDIQFSTVQKCNQNMTSTINSVCLNNLKNINKNITIKSISKASADKEDTNKQAQLHENLETPHQLKNQLQIKPSKQVMKEPQLENNIFTNKSLQKVGHIVDHTSAQSSNKKMSTINQVNSVNKEVTVKTFQTKTVIQEITTTVTKTIKTVNQTMKQEVRNTCQTSAPMMPQRVQGMRPHQQKNLQGVVIRHASPTIGNRPSNVVSQIRPASTVVRPAKQIVPMRAAITRPPNPRMAVGKKVTPAPSTNKNKQVIEKTLKISPGAMTAPITKRPNTEDVSGPFSCFKKPKESLIPVSDVPTFTSTAGEAKVQYAAASHSSSNFTSTTKVIKGKSMVTAKQTKSEVSSSQQLSRQFSNNTTGLKITTSQGKQSQVQEKSENSAVKRTTLEAIERLQKQGLLVKKPRMDANEGSGDSDHDGDDNLGYSSTENDE